MTQTQQKTTNIPAQQTFKHNRNKDNQQND